MNNRQKVTIPVVASVLGFKLDMKRSYSTCFPPAVPLVRFARQINLLKVPETKTNYRKIISPPSAP